MTGRRGPGSKEASVVQPTNVSTLAKPVPHQTRRAKPPATSAPSCHYAPAPRRTPEQLRLRERQFQQRRRRICGLTLAWHSQLYHHGTVAMPTLGCRQLAPPWRHWSKLAQTTAGHTTMESLTKPNHHRLRACCADSQGHVTAHHQPNRRTTASSPATSSPDAA
jgi:hypothetical protein